MWLDVKYLTRLPVFDIVLLFRWTLDGLILFLAVKWGYSGENKTSPKCICPLENINALIPYVGWELPWTSRYNIIAMLRCRYDMYCDSNQTLFVTWAEYNKTLLWNATYNPLTNSADSHDSICIAIQYCNFIAIWCSKHIAYYISAADRRENMRKWVLISHGNKCWKHWLTI